MAEMESSVGYNNTRSRSGKLRRFEGFGFGLYKYVFSESRIAYRVDVVGEATTTILHSPKIFFILHGTLQNLR
jgi:hypothetical protein